MKQQKDWYIGTDYYVDYKEKQIQAEELDLTEPLERQLHEQAELYYILEGRGEAWVNGTRFALERGSFLCLYMYHFYRIRSTDAPLKAVRISFYIGHFMSMCLEENPKNVNAMLVYDTSPLVQLDLAEQAVVEGLAHTAVREQSQPRFGSQNMVSYLTMQLHILHCRYALERLKDPVPSGREGLGIWQLIQQIILTTDKPFTLQAAARERGVSAGYLNKQIKLASGYTFFQLQKFGKILNACALLHFPELSMEYISGLLHFSNLQDFYRVFRRYMHKSPQEYRKQDIFRPVERSPDCGSALLFLQYLHLNFSRKITPATLAQEFHMKEYTVCRIFEQVYQMTFSEMLEQIRVQYACAYLTGSDVKITQISERCGFESFSTFHRTFRKHCFVSPGAYRKNQI